MVHFENSYINGKLSETRVLPDIINYFKTDIKINPEQYGKYDFTDSTTQYELKTRTNTLSKYPDTLITFNKCSTEQDLILLFAFTDCLTYIKYNKETFSHYKKKMFSRANLKQDEKLHVYIPIEDLILIRQF